MAETEVKVETKEYTQRQLRMAVLAILFASIAYWFTRFKTVSILPVIAGDLDGMKYYSWASMMFMLCATIVAPLWGKVSDIFGRKNILLILLALMIVGDLVCAFAGNIFVFIAGFGICGLGGGGMQGTYYALLGDLFPPDRRGKYGGLILMLMSTTQLLLPIISARITELSSWRNVFYLTSAVYAIAGVMTLMFIPSMKAPGAIKRMDFLGTFFLACALVPFMLVLSWGGSAYAWGSPRILSLSAIALVMFVVAYFYERSIPDYAVISTRLLKNYSYLFACLISIFMAFSMSAVSTYLSLFCQGVQGMSATLYSTINVPASVCAIFSGGLAGWLMDKTKRYKWLLVLAPTSAMITCVIYGLMPASTPILFIIAVRVFQQVCGASFMPSINPLAAMAQIDPKDYGVGTGTLNLITNCGNSIAPALLGSVMNGAYARNIAAKTASIASKLTTEQVRMISDARVLVNAKAMSSLGKTFGSDTALLDQVVQLVRESLKGAISSVFLAAAVCVFFSIVFAMLVKEVPLDQIEARKQSGR